MTDGSFKRADWLTTTNIYEVNTRQYTIEGTFNAFVKELPRLKDMGVEVLWFMPIHPIGKINRKGKLGSYYSIMDFKAVNPEFGTADDFNDLIKQAHSLGMKVIMDWVANHVAWDNIWTIDHPEYFERDSDGNFKPPYDWTDVIQIDHSNAAQQDAMIDAMKFWITDFDIDGFRADLAHLTPLEFWKRARTAIEPLKPGLFWLAETEEINYHEVFDASFTWEWMHFTEDYYKKETGLSSLYSVLHKYQTSFPADAFRMYFTSNHDENTWNGTEYEKYGDMAKALAVFSFTWNGIPMIYSGQEMPNLKRLEFFEKDVIAWNGEYALHDFYKTLLELRKKNPALRTNDPAVVTHFIITNDDKCIMAYLRKNKNDEVLVLLNLSKEKRSFVIKDQLINGSFINVFSKTKNYLTTDTSVEMQPWDFLVYEKI
ncbi:MAG: alpha-amylase family glycosyl hydrolase [Ferruginibacter sp.]